MDEIVFDVFARKNRGDPLAHIGYLSAPDKELARIYAWKTYDEESWFEMCVVPRSEIIPVNRTDGPFAAGGAGKRGARR
jgi:1,2-phenylacetyl-CoA epoxidase PaaB subunit